MSRELSREQSGKWAKGPYPVARVARLAQVTRLARLARLARVAFVVACYWAAGALVGLLPFARNANAREFEVPIEVGTAEEIYDLLREGDIDDETAELLLAFLERPIDLNRADRELLYELPGMTYELADAIIARRAASGGFRSLDAIADVEGMNATVLRAVTPFLKVTSTPAGAGEGAGEGAGNAPSSRVLGFGGAVEMGGVAIRQISSKAIGDAATAQQAAAAAAAASGGVDGDNGLVTPTQERSAQGYVRLRAEATSYANAGALVTYRRLTDDARWSYDRGQLVSQGEGGHAELDAVYVSGGYRLWKAVLGSYTVGFGERLTFDNSRRERPSGWVENDAVRIASADGTVTPVRGLFGGAVSMLGANVPGGWLDATVFASSTRPDLYQYDLWVGYDDYGGGGSDTVCDTDSDCDGDYTCGDDHRCHATAVVNPEDGTALRWQTYDDAFSEILVGGNVNWNFDERKGFGLTAYRSSVKMLVGSEADANFAWSARYPRRRQFGALGLDARWGIGQLDVFGEVALTDNKGVAWDLRGVVSPARWAELSLALRSFGADYDNPHGRGESARDEAFGLTARNERGLRLRSSLKPWSRLALVSDIDVWENPKQAVFEDDQLVWRARAERLFDLRATQRISLDVTRREQIGGYVRYANNDLQRNSRRESYAGGDEDGHGEQRSVQAELSTTRIPRTLLSAKLKWVWEDAGTCDPRSNMLCKNVFFDRFDRAQQLAVRLRVRPWEDTMLVARVSYWWSQAERSIERTNADGEDRSFDYERDARDLDAYIDVKQRFGGRVWASLRYGVTNDRTASSDRWYHVGKLVLESEI